jgi:hypothetical protein
MSIWTTVGGDGPDIVGVPEDGAAAHYEGHGSATAVVDVSVTAFHDKVRLGIECDGSTKDVLLDRDNVALLRDRLSAALEGTA